MPTWTDSPSCSVPLLGRRSAFAVGFLTRRCGTCWSNSNRKRLASRWNRLLRRLWAVENECHHTFDTGFAEDDRRWIEVDPVGALVIVILRRIAYSLLAFYRAVTLRSEERRYPPWKDLLTRIFVAMVAATTDVVSGLRLRFVAAAPTP